MHSWTNSEVSHSSLSGLLQTQLEVLTSETAFVFLPDGELARAQSLDYDAFGRRVRRLSAALQQTLPPGENVLLCYPPGLDYVVAFWACISAGLVAVPAYPPDPVRPERTLPRLRAIVDSAGARLLLTSAEVVSLVEPFVQQAAGLGEVQLWAPDAATLPAPPANWTPPSLSPDDLAFLMYTSGSTGHPKGVMVSHGNVLHNLHSFQGFVDRPAGAIVSWLPLFHDLGLLLSVLHPVFRGIPAILMPPEAFVQNPYRWLQALSYYGATTSGGPNFAYELCVARTTEEQRATLDLSAWNLALNGAEPVRHATLERFAAAFAPCGFRPEAFYPSYGMAENTATVTGGVGWSAPRVRTVSRRDLEQGRVVATGAESDDAVMLVGCGQTLPEQSLRIVDPETGRESPPGEIGEVWVSGPSVGQGYWRRSEASRETFQAQITGGDGARYLRTGDLGFLDGEELYLTGRLKDVIIIRGANHYPEDIEATVVQAHPALKPGGCTACSVEAGGSERLVIVAEVRPRAAGEGEAIFAALRQRIAMVHDLEAYAISLIKPATTLKTSSGKLRRRATRSAFLNGELELVSEWRAGLQSLSAPEFPPVREHNGERPAVERQIVAWLRAYFAHRTGLAPEAIGLDEPFARYGLGSLEALSLIHDLELWLGRTLLPTLAWNYPTIAALARHLAGNFDLEEVVVARSEDHEEHIALVEPIAIIGMSCRFPGADGLQAFWDLLAQGRDAITEVPPDRWDVDAFFDPNPQAKGKILGRWGGYLENLDQFDAPFFGISPREAAQLDPRQRLMLESAWEALEDAGVPPLSLAGTQAGVFVATLKDDYGSRIFDDFDIIELYSGTGSANTVVANRISYFLDLHGPSVVIDTACSGSLVAIHLACQSLRQGECPIALAGGVNVILEPDSDIFFSRAGALSPDGRCKTFDSAANGIVRGEGAATIVLKPLARALADGDRIYAVVQGSAVNHDGRSNGIMAPNGTAQEQVLRMAYRNAGLDPNAVQYIEAHGTGTPLGDPIEVKALSNVVGSERAEGDVCVLGSVKTNVGHGEAVAGMGGVIKAVLAMQHDVIPPHLNFQEPNPLIPFHELPFVVPRQLTPWPRPDAPKVAGVSGFGFGGTNAHVVLCEPPARSVTDATSPATETPVAHLLPLSAKTPEGLRALAAAYVELLRSETVPALVDLCYTAGVGRSHLSQRLAAVGATPAALVEQLEGFLNDEMLGGLSTGPARADQPPPLVWVFSGQGAQWFGMGTELLATEPVFRATLEACDRIFQELGDWSLLEALQADPERSHLNDTVIAQPAIFAVQVALAALWRAWGLTPDIIVGQSLGEVAAAHVAGALTLEEAARVVFHRSRLMKSVEGQGKSAVVGLPLDRAGLVLTGFDDVVSVAGSNSPSASLISGDADAVTRIVASLERQGVFARILRGVDIAFHSPQMDPLRGELEAELQDLAPRATHVPLFSTVTGTLIDGTQLDAAYWGRNLREPFLFTEALRQLAESGYEHFLEINAHPVLSMSIRQGLDEFQKPGLIVASLRRDAEERATLLAALGRLYVAGVPLDFRRLYAERRQPISLPHYAWQREHYWLDQITSKPLGASGQIGVKKAGAHPLLGEHVVTSVAPRQHLWELDVTASSTPYYVDHQVQGMVILPGAAYLEMALAAARQAFGPGAYTVQQLRFLRGLQLPAAPGRRLQVVLTPALGEESAFHALSTAAEAGVPWVEHVTGRVRALPESPAAPAPVALAEVRRRCTEALPPEEHYAAMEARGLSYGPAFRALQEIHRCEGEALSRIVLPESLLSDARSYTLHPVLLDAAFQSVAVTLPREGDGDAAFLPAGVEALHLYGEPEGVLWCHARLTATPDAAPERREADLTLCTESGAVVAQITGLRLERVSAGRREQLRRQLYDLRWVAQPLPEEAATSPPAPVTWLLFTGDAEDPLAAALRERGDTCLTVRPGTDFHAGGTDYTIDPEAPEAYARLLAEALTTSRPPCGGIIYRWSDLIPAPDSAPAAHLEAAQRYGARSPLFLIQALAGARLNARPRLWLLTRGAQPITSAEPSLPERALLWGLGRVAAAEHPELRVTLLDLSVAAEPEELSALLAELANKGAENQVALRGERRYVARLARHLPLSSSANADRVLTHSATAPFRLESVTPGVLDSLTPRATRRRPPGPGEVEIEVYATGLNFKDVMLALGMLPPLPNGSRPLGLECAGRVVAVGAGVERLQVGDEVIGGADHCFSRYVTTDAWLVGPKPAHLTFEEAATLLVAFGTTYYALVRLADLREGERVLIHTASGAVGQAAIQLARLRGAEIYATAGTPEKRAFLRDELGIAHVMDSRSLDFAAELLALTNGEGVDVVLNTLSGAGITRSLEVLKPHGRFLELGKRDIVQNSPLGMGLLERNISFFVVDLNQMMRDRPQYVGELLKELWPLFEDGRIQPITHRSFPIDGVAEVFHLMSQARHIGKLVVNQRDVVLPIAPPAPQPVTVRADASYLITGGLGGLGRTVARWLAEQGARHLVLTSRRGRDGLTPEAAEAVAALEAEGVAVHILAGDVARAEDVDRLLAHIAAELPPLRGIVHSAGVLRDGLLLQMSPAQLEMVLAPKVYGAWHLHRASAEAPLDFFVLFSSIAALLGPPGQANYAAGNAFMDALARTRRAHGLPALSINWGPWSEVGMAARGALGEQHASGGILPLTPAEGVELLDLLLEEHPAQVAAVAIDWQQLGQATPAGMQPPLLSDLLATEAAAAGAEAGSGANFATEVLLVAPPEERLTLLETHLQTLTAGVMRLDRERLPVQQPLNALGIDSIMAVELKSKIEGSLGVTVSVADLLRGLSVADLAAQFLPQLQATVPADAEVAELLAETGELSDTELEALLRAAEEELE